MFCDSLLGFSGGGINTGRRFRTTLRSPGAFLQKRVVVSSQDGPTAGISEAREGIASRPWGRDAFISRLIVPRIIFALAAAILLTCSLPGPDLGWLAWIALVPLILACNKSHPVEAAGLGLVSGIVASFGILGWVFEAPSFDLRHAILLAIYAALYPALWCAGVSVITRTGIASAFPIAALWVVLDYVRANVGVMALPWGTLAHTQHRNLAVLQIAAVTGEYGVTFFIVLGNAAIAALLIQRAWRQAAFAAGLLTLAHIGGVFVLYAQPPGPTVRVAVIQPNIALDEQATMSGRRASFDRLEQLTTAAAAQHPTLIAWPETAVSGDLQSNPFLVADLQSLAQAIGIPLVLGVSEVQKFASRDTNGDSHRRAYNSAYLVAPGEPLAPPYRKRRLVPFGEYVPYEGMIPWPAWIGGRGYDTTPGSGPQLFTLQNGTPFATLICWESVFSGLSREAVASGARLLVQLNNPVSFGHTAAGKQQNLSSVLRAVENRVPVLLASNTGPSQIIDSYGRVVTHTTEIFVAGMVVGDVPLGSGGTPYTKTGDLFVLSLFSALAFGALLRRSAFACGRASAMPRATGAMVCNTHSRSKEIT